MDIAGVRTRGAYPALLALGALDAAAYSVIAPILPEIAQRTGAGPTVLGVLVAAFPMGIVVGFPLAGRASVARRPRAVLLGSIALLGLGSVGFAFGDGLATFFASRFVMGVGSGGLWIAVTFDTIARWPGQEYVCMSRILAAYSVGGLIGPTLGALGGITRPFLGYLALATVGAAVALLLPQVGSVRFQSDWRSLGVRRFWAACAGVLFAYLALGVVEGVLPLHFSPTFDQQTLGLAYFGMSIVVAFAAGAAARYVPKSMVVVSAVAVSVGIAVAGASTEALVWAVGLVVTAVGIGAGTTGSTGVLLDAVPSKRIVAAMVVWSEIGILGYLGGPLLGGAVAEQGGFKLIGIVPVLGAIATLATFYWSERRA
jgi:MFS family permease